jgi:hypothetical protein
MQEQSFERHTHQPVIIGVGYLFLWLALISFALRWFLIGGRVTMALGLFCLCAAVQVLLYTSRRYTTALQDRIIKLEMRVRAAAFLTPEQQRLLMQLDTKQIVALRSRPTPRCPRSSNARRARNCRRRRSSGRSRRGCPTMTVPKMLNVG